MSDRYAEHDPAIDTAASYMYFEIASRSTIDPADIPHPTHVYHTRVRVVECVDTEVIKQKVENHREWRPLRLKCWS